MNVQLSAAVFLLGMALTSSVSGGYEDAGVLNFVIMGDWGGTDLPPFTTTAEKEVSSFPNRSTNGHWPVVVGLGFGCTAEAKEGQFQQVG